MVMHKGIKIQQNLNDWLVRARSHHICLQHTPELERDLSETGLDRELQGIRAGT